MVEAAGDVPGWLTVAELGDADDWPEVYWPAGIAEFDDLQSLEVLLAAARAQCEAFAPRLPEGAPVPETYRLAQAMQARALFRSTITGDGDQTVGADGHRVTVFPLDWTIKALLRPKRRPVIR